MTYQGLATLLATSSRYKGTLIIPTRHNIIIGIGYEVRRTGDNSNQRKPRRCNDKSFSRNHDSELCFVLVIPNRFLYLVVFYQPGIYYEHSILVFYSITVSPIPSFSWCYFHYIIIIDYDYYWLLLIMIISNRLGDIFKPPFQKSLRR